MKLKEKFTTRMVGDTQLMVDSSDSEEKFLGMVKSNEVAAFLIDKLKNDVSEAELVDSLLHEYEVGEEEALDAVRYVVEQMSSINAIDF